MNGMSGEDAYILGMDYADEKLDGVSPKITENANNTDKDYKLDIETADGTFTTPNLMASVVVDSSLNYYSQNPVQNSAVTNKFDETVSGELYIPAQLSSVSYVTVPLRYQEEDTTGHKHLIILSDALGDLVFISGLSINGTIKAYRVGNVAEPNIKKLYYKNFGDYLRATLYIERTKNTSPITIYGASGANSHTQGYVSGLIEIEIEDVSKNSIKDTAIGSDITWSSEKISNDYSSKEYVAEQISNSLHLRKEIVTTIPTVDEAEENVIYMVKDATATSGDMYKEYQLINGAVVQTGDTSIDLSGYAKLEDVEGKQCGLVANAQNFKIDITKNNAYWYGMFTFNFVYGSTPCEITVTIIDKVYYTITKGQNVVSAITYTQDGANYTIGIDFTAKIYGTQVVEMSSEFGTINSLTDESYTGTTNATLKLISSRTYTTLAELGLTASATVENVIAALPIGGKALISTHEFTNYQTLFPYSVEADQFATLNVEKGYDTTGSRTIVTWVRKDASRIVYGGLDSTNAVRWWNEVAMKESFAGKTVKTVTIDLSASDLNATYTGLNKMVLDNYIVGTVNVIKAEGYYIPPSDASGYIKTTVQAYTDQKVGNIFYEMGSWKIGVAGSETGNKGSGFAKIYYVE